MTVAYDYQRKLVKEDKCPHCQGSKQATYGYDMDDSVHIGRCHHCGGAGKPTAEDLKDVAVMDSGICVVCKLPFVPGNANPDCKDHVLQEVHRLRRIVDELAKR